MRFAVRFAVQFAVRCRMRFCVRRRMGNRKTDTKSQAKSQMRFGVAAAIWCRRCDSGWRSCDLVSDLLHEQKIERDSCRTRNCRYTKSHLRGAGYTSDLVRAIYCKLQMRFGASAIWCPTRITSYLFFAPNRRCDLVYLRFGLRVRTPNRYTISHATCKR
jgi:hypothetical protein